MSECGCYVAHGVEHLCPTHEIYLPTRVELWVEADLCRECICDEIELLEARLERKKRRLRKARTPRDGLLPPEASPFEIRDESSDTENENHDDDDPEQHPRDSSDSQGRPSFI